MHALLLTLTSEGRARTFAFDESARSILWVGNFATEDPSRALASVESSEEGVALAPVRGCTLSTAAGEPVEKAMLPTEGEAVFSIGSPNMASPAILYVRTSTAGGRTYRKLGFSHDADVLIGRDERAQLSYRSRFVSAQHARLTLRGDVFSVTDLGSANGTYVNGLLIPANAQQTLVAGDIVTIFDLVIMIGHRLVSFNEPSGLVVGEIPGAGLIGHAAFRDMCPPASETTGDQPLFYPAPRLMHSVHKRAFQVDDPPAAKKPDDQPALMSLGPSFVMGLASIFMVVSAISRLMNGADALTTMPMIAMSCSMIAGTVLWPIISKRWTKKRDAREEMRRESKYGDYLNKMESKFGEECETQGEILRENRVPTPDLAQRAFDLSPRLMNRSVLHDDCMDLRVGMGDTDLQADIRWPQQRFTMDDDKLLDKVTALADNPPKVREVPLAFNPAKDYVAGIIGSRAQVWNFARGLIVQICSLYGYQDVKLMFVVDPDEVDEWSFARTLPHAFDDTGNARFIAANMDELMDLGMHLERDMEVRSQIRADDFSDYGAYYVVLCANKALTERSDTVTKLTKQRTNRGMSVIFFGDDLKDLPRECAYVIDLTGEGLAMLGHASSDLGKPAAKERAARMFARNDVSGTMQEFDPDIDISAEQARAFALALARVRLDLPSQRTALPKSLGFLEMFEAGTTAHLNIGQRWAEHDASRSLQTPLGFDPQGEYSMLNLHENVHGPHGLIAGTTGSGKSEFIITYILSMCVNYPPDQVAFVLIDYKGGGLAGAFDNDRYRLPHLAGTITNLDGAAISRSLVSIKSELKRRQDMLNHARDITGEATVDIYKYLSYYRQGVLTEPLPHLFIVADEFAELKAQEPEFMDELISAARIGRSLGVHLILATQKPTGVVNDQIWSNSRFKVCLKVADAADSKEMIKRPDAAEIKGPGRFYLLVGYNEYFAAGQAAYCGAPYKPTDHFEPKRDNAVELLDNEANAVATLRPPSNAKTSGTSELNAVLDQIMRTAGLLHKKAKTLWLEPMPPRIVLDDLVKKYGFEQPEGSFKLVVGEADDPERQRQFLYSIDMVEAGNVMMYGDQNSGIDGLLSTMLYSLAQAYDARDFSLYIADLGAGSLMCFSELPQCGGVVLSGDDERIENLFKLVEGEIVRRRKLFAEAGGLSAYNAQASEDDRVPHMVVVIGNMAAFNELYGANYEERLVSVTRDAPRYGIHFIITASAATTPRMRLKANFGANLITAFNDPNDYVTMLGSMAGIVAPRQDKRGLMKIEKTVFEYQGASVTEDDLTTAKAVRALARAVREQCPREAIRIPELPDRVLAEHMLPLGGGSPDRVVPIGFSKADVEPVSFDLKKSPYMLVLGNDVDANARYLRGIREVLAADGRQTYAFFDSESIMGPTVAEDEHVYQGNDAVGEAVLKLTSGELTAQILVFTSIAQTIAGIDDEASKALQEYISKEKCSGTAGIVAASEMWRLKGNYQDWYKVLSAYGNGVWVGSGFADQTMFRFSRALPEYRVPAARSEGFFTMRGDVVGVRCVEAEGEPMD